MGLQTSKYMSRSRGGRASHMGNGTEVDEGPGSTAKNQTRYPVSLRLLRAGIYCRSTISRLIRIIITPVSKDQSYQQLEIIEMKLVIYRENES